MYSLFFVIVTEYVNLGWENGAEGSSSVGASVWQKGKLFMTVSTIDS